jgi:hypothetical protein
MIKQRKEPMHMAKCTQMGKPFLSIYNTHRVDLRNYFYNTNFRLIQKRDLNLEMYKRPVNTTSCINTCNIFSSDEYFLKYSIAFFKILNSQLRPITNRSNIVPSAVRMVLLILLLPAMFTTNLFYVAFRDAKYVTLPQFVWHYERYLKHVDISSSKSFSGLSGVINSDTYPIDKNISDIILNHLTISHIRAMFETTAFTYLLSGDAEHSTILVKDYTGKNRFISALKLALSSFDMTTNDSSLLDSLSSFFLDFNTYFYSQLTLSSKVVSDISTDKVGLHKFRNSYKEDEYYVQNPCLKSISSEEEQTAVLTFLKLFSPTFAFGDTQTLTIPRGRLQNDVILAIYDITMHDVFLVLLNVRVVILPQPAEPNNGNPNGQMRQYSTLSSVRPKTGLMIGHSYFGYKLLFKDWNVLRLVV